MTTDPNIDELNNFCQDWANSVATKMKANAKRMAKNGGRELSSSIKALVSKKDGEVEKISFKLKRSGIMFQKDVGRGRPMGHSGQTEKPWFNDSLNDPDGVSKLSEYISNNYSDRMINLSRTLI